MPDNENPTGENEDAEDQNDDGDEDADGEGETEYTPPTKDEHARMVRALARRKSERDTARRELAAAKAGKPGKGDSTGAADSEDATPGTDPDARVKRLAGIAALASEGMTRDQARAAVRMLDLSDVEVDDDGEADGLEDAVADLKARFPAMFTRAEDDEGSTRRRPRPRTSGGRSADGGNAKAPDDKHTDRLLKAAGYR